MARLSSSISRLGGPWSAWEARICIVLALAVSLIRQLPYVFLALRMYFWLWRSYVFLALAERRFVCISGFGGSACISGFGAPYVFLVSVYFSGHII